MPTFYVQHNGSADVELLLVDHDAELAGVDAGVGRLHGGDQQVSVEEGAPCVRLELGGHGVLRGNKSGQR